MRGRRRLTEDRGTEVAREDPRPARALVASCAADHAEQGHGNENEGAGGGYPPLHLDVLKVKPGGRGDDEDLGDMRVDAVPGIDGPGLQPSDGSDVGVHGDDGRGEGDESNE